jgi:single-stranded-DNA-specific exonuclease
MFDMLNRQWIYRTTHPPENLEQLLNIICHNRNYNLKQANSITHWSSRLNLPNLDLAVQQIHTAINQNQKIVVFGDYDVDGISATAILWETLHELGANVIPYIPHREKEGYGLSHAALDHVIKTYHPNLIITVDNGISATAEIDYAKTLEVEIIVTDHHALPQNLPKTTIIHDHHVCGAFVSWKLAYALKYYNSHNPQAVNYDDLDTHLQEKLGLVALGTICDIIPLTPENKSVVKHGLQQLRHTSRPGIRALCEVANIPQHQISTYHLGFILGPRLNAQGRLDSAMNALRLLCTTKPTRAYQLAASINNLNTQRQNLTKELATQAEQLAHTSNTNLLFVGHQSWNPGVIGLIASHLVKTYHKPAIVWGASEDNLQILKASARSIEGFNIIEAIRKYQHLLLHHGGHPMAAGFSMQQANLSEFSQQISTYAQHQLSTDLLTPKLYIDTLLPPHLINLDTYHALTQLAPFGTAFPEPIFALEKISCSHKKIVGQKHLKLTLQTPNQQVKAIGFDLAEKYSNLKDQLHIAFHLDQNIWNNQASVQIKLIDIKS